MNRKKAITAFSVISVFKFVLGAVVVLLLLSLVWTFLSPQKTAEASTRKALDDIIVKMATNAFESGQPVIANGYVDKDAAIIGFSSDQLKASEFVRPKQCGSRSNSCICAIKDSVKVLECKGFPSGKISTIVMGGSSLKIDGGAAGKSFTLELSLSGKTLNARELT